MIATELELALTRCDPSCRTPCPIHLTDHQREVFLLAHRGMGTRSIALALHLSRSAVQSRLENARHKIHQARKDAA